MTSAADSRGRWSNAGSGGGGGSSERGGGIGSGGVCGLRTGGDSMVAGAPAGPDGTGDSCADCPGQAASPNQITTATARQTLQRRGVRQPEGCAKRLMVACWRRLPAQQPVFPL